VQGGAIEKATPAIRRQVRSHPFEDHYAPAPKRFHCRNHVHNLRHILTYLGTGSPVTTAIRVHVNTDRPLRYWCWVWRFAGALDTPLQTHCALSRQQHSL